ncbi:MAG: hypothetical protein Q9173_003187 [Seirophora scorigena]
MKFFSNTALLILFLAIACDSHPAEPRTSPFIPDSMLRDVTCDSRSDWSANNFLKEDCYNSVLNVFLQDYRPNAKAIFDFYSSPFPPPPGSNMIQTPRRYTTKSCTLALVMLYKFGPTEVPGAQRRGHALTELATFEEIYRTARRLEEKCILGQGQSHLAWEPVGECQSKCAPVNGEKPADRSLGVGATRSLGLFFWATDSIINRDKRFRNPVGGNYPTNAPLIALDRDVSID